MSQPPQPPPVGTVVNGYQWDGRQWVPLPQVGQVVNGHRWDGQQWVPLPQPVPQWTPQPTPQPMSQPTPQPMSQPTPPPTPTPVPPPAAAPEPAAFASGGQPAPASSAHEWILTELGKLAQAWQFEWRQKADQVILSRVVAEQKALMATGQLTYEARIRIDDARREVRFTELLKESRSGMSSGGDDDFGPSGFGVQRTSYNSRTDTVQDSIEEQAARYRSKYPLDFRYDAVSPQVRGIAETAGYTLAYGVLN